MPIGSPVSIGAIRFPRLLGLPADQILRVRVVVLLLVPVLLVAGGLLPIASVGPQGLTGGKACSSHERCRMPYGTAPGPIADQRKQKPG